MAETKEKLRVKEMKEAIELYIEKYSKSGLKNLYKNFPDML